MKCNCCSSGILKNHGEVLSLRNSIPYKPPLGITRQVYKKKAIGKKIPHGYLSARHIRGKFCVSCLIIYLSGDIVNRI